MTQITRGNGSVPVRVRKTITFADVAGQGAVGTVAVYTVTGAVHIDKLTARCTTSLESAGGGIITLGDASDVDGFIVASTATSIDSGMMWASGAPGTLLSLGQAATGGATTQQINKVANGTTINVTVATAAVTAGVVVFDVWYTPVTDGATIS